MSRTRTYYAKIEVCPDGIVIGRVLGLKILVSGSEYYDVRNHTRVALQELLDYGREKLGLTPPESVYESGAVPIEVEI